MRTLKLVSWNVNGIRAALKKGFLDWLKQESPDIAALQETKAQFEQVRNDFILPDGYSVHWNAGERKGYSGVVCLTKLKPLSVRNGFGIERFDKEGRIIVMEFPEFTFLNIYFPNGKQSQERLDYKMDFYDATLDYCQALRKQGKKLIVCGDYNTAHKEIDLKHPKANADQSGFLPIERAWIDKFIAHGYVDIFRTFYPDEPDQYTWWTYRMNARAKNVGWRIDYFFVSEDLKDTVTGAHITTEVLGSDHCPIILELKI
ncbi:exodeoxyribonuclease III [candidate division KSB1 bacterium]|nr:exodeoxyribonuclease III [candidate division KSB1 bacterium]